MNLDIIKLSFRSPLHFGEKGGMMETSDYHLSSDTLFSALCDGISLLYGQNKIKQLLLEFASGKPPFLLSSCFPFWQNSLFLPCPLGIELPLKEWEPKKLKRIKYLPVEMWGNQDLWSRKKWNTIQDGIILISDELKAPFYLWQEKEITRVILDSLSCSSHVFNFRQIVFNKGGLYFLVKWLDRSWEGFFKAAVSLLGDEGIGGDRKCGHGLFTPFFTTGEIELPDPHPDKKSCLLSLYYPTLDEVSRLEGNYNFKVRAGYVYSFSSTTHRRKTIRMFGEGSTFTGLRENAGSMVEVTPPGHIDHQVFKLGLALAVGAPEIKNGVVE